jgi:hypothetical protein
MYKGDKRRLAPETRITDVLEDGSRTYLVPSGWHVRSIQSFVLAGPQTNLKMIAEGEQAKQARPYESDLGEM